MLQTRGALNRVAYVPNFTQRYTLRFIIATGYDLVPASEVVCLSTGRTDLLTILGSFTRPPCTEYEVMMRLGALVEGPSMASQAI